MCPGWTILGMVGAIGFEPTTPCAQVLVSRRINALAQFGCVQIR